MSSYFEYEKYNFPDWDGYGADPIGPETVKLGRALYDLLNGQRPDDAPGGDGSIGFEWRNGDDMLCLDVHGDEFRLYGKMGGKFYRSLQKSGLEWRPNMRGTMIVYAHPDTLHLAAEHGRFSPTRTRLFERAYAAWLVFTGRADALCWDEWRT